MGAGGGEKMPVYEYQCKSCGKVSSFIEKMFERPRLFKRKKRCKHCGGKKLEKILSVCAGKVERTHTESLNELKSMGNVQFTPPNPKPPRGNGPPPGGCPYEKAAKEELGAKEKQAAEKKAREPIRVR
jgi:putative FmdB family regulatory protein